MLLISVPDHSTSLRAKILWDSDPDNAAYFANYAVSYLSDTNELPAGFMETARRLDPENSFFPYLAAANEVLPVRMTLLTSRGGKSTTDPYEHVLSLFHDAGKLPRFDNYLIQLRRERIPLLPQSTIFEYMDSVNFLARSYAPDLGLRNLTGAIESKSAMLLNSGDKTGFIELKRDVEAFLRNLSQVHTDSSERLIINGNEINDVLESLAFDATRLELDGDAAELQSKIDRLKQWDTDRRANTYQIDGREWGARGGILKSRFIRIKQAAHPPVLTDHDIKPGRMFDHAVFAQICSYAVAGALGLVSVSVALFRFRSPPLMRRLSARMEVLLRPGDWLWLLAAVFPPLLYLMLVAHLTDLGGYGSAFFVRPIDLPYGWAANLPMVQFAGVLLMMLILPILVARWRLGIRGAAFGFANTRLLLGAFALLSATVFIPVVGWAVIAESTPGLVAAWVLLVFPFAWLCGVVGSAMICRTGWLLHHTTASRVLVPVYVAGLIFLLLAMPFFKASRQYWFERDSLTHLDLAYPGFSKFEYDLSAAARKELREALGYAP